MKSVFAGRSKLDLLLFAILLLLLFCMPLISRDYGITWDERDNLRYGEATLDYYVSGFQTMSYHGDPRLIYNGAFSDLIGALAVRIFNNFDPYDVRHGVNSLFGWTAILFTSLLARRLYGNLAGVLACLMMMLSPRFIGHSMNNPKDIPFAAMFILSLYSLSKIKKRYPYASPAVAIQIILSIALCLNIRFGGLILIFYAALLMAVYVITDKQYQLPKNNFAVISIFLVCAALTIVIGTITCPWALANPLMRPFQAVVFMSRFNWAGGVLFEGRWISAPSLPWNYLPVWLLIVTPVGILLSAFFSLSLVGKPAQRFGVISLLLTLLFPICYVISTNSVVYDEMRHFLFIYPSLVILAAAGWSSFYELVKSRTRYAFAIFSALFVIVFWHPARFEWKNHPNEVTYFNQLVGGIRGAFGKYELDYWGNSMKQAVDWIAGQAQQSARVVSFSVEDKPKHLAEIYGRRFDLLQYKTDWTKTDYYLVLLRVSPTRLHQILNQGQIVYRVTADGVPLCVVKRGK